jgi:tRNA A-37 threonylcarbamoyl transferase component Bud32
VGPLDSFAERRERHGVAWVRQDLAALPLEQFWGALEPLAGARGRGGVGTLSLGGVPCVVRPFRRGGALGAILRDRYTGPSRARRELEVLAALRQEGVPVVVPVAAVARKGRAFWRLRLCTELLPGALPLPQFLAAFPALRRHTATAVGTVLRLAFAAGLRHPDLHADNVLCQARGEKVRVVLVDLDRAQLRTGVAAAARDDMLVRMQRYHVRHRGVMAAAPTRAETMRALRALEPDRERRHAWWRTLAGKLSRALRRRRLLPRTGEHA